MRQKNKATGDREKRKENNFQESIIVPREMRNEQDSMKRTSEEQKLPIR